MAERFKKPGNYIYPVWKSLKEGTKKLEDFGKLREVEQTVIGNIDISGFKKLFDNLKLGKDSTDEIKAFLDIFFDKACKLFKHSEACHPFKFLGDGLLLRCNIESFKSKFHKIISTITALIVTLKEFVKELIRRNLCKKYNYEKELGITSVFSLCKSGLYEGGINTERYFDSSYWGSDLNNLSKTASTKITNKRFSINTGLFSELTKEHKEMFNKPFKESGIYFRSINQKKLII